MCLNSSGCHLSGPKEWLHFQVYPKFSLPPLCFQQNWILLWISLWSIQSTITHFLPWLTEKGNHYAFPTKSYLSIGMHYPTINRTVILKARPVGYISFALWGKCFQPTFISILKLKTNLVNLTQLRVRIILYGFFETGDSSHIWNSCYLPPFWTQTQQRKGKGSEKIKAKYTYKRSLQ